MIDICYVCEFKVSKKELPVADRRPSYADCDKCGKPTCKGHGRTVPNDGFRCVRCIARMQ